MRFNCLSVHLNKQKTEAIMNRTYSPVALVVDDDPNVIKRVRRGFLEDTGLGILHTTDLKTAKRYLDEDDLKIDFLLTDLGFAMHESADDDELDNGLDLIRYSAKRRPDNPSWVYSALADDPFFRTRAREMELEIEEWFPKLGGPVPWPKVERDFLLKKLKRGDEDLTKLASDANIDLRAPEMSEVMADRFLKVIRLPRRTYLTELPEPWSALKPIEAWVVQEGKDLHVASAPQLGIIANAQGSNVDEALDGLRDLIAKEAANLLDPKKRLRGYAEFVRGKLREFVAKTQPLAA